jgi:putative endonuclease
LPGVNPDRRYYAYIMASASGVLYTGSTSDLLRRVYQHKHGLLSRFTAEYAVTKLVYYEGTGNSRAAVAREREIKKWRRERKVQLIEAGNPGWMDFAAGWFPDTSGQDPSLRSG